MVTWPLPPPPAPRLPGSQFLEGELKQTYSSKNFALKAKLLDLSKKFREQIDSDVNVAALWSDVEVLLVRTATAAQTGAPACGPGWRSRGGAGLDRWSPGVQGVQHRLQGWGDSSGR